MSFHLLPPLVPPVDNPRVSFPAHAVGFSKLSTPLVRGSNTPYVDAASPLVSAFTVGAALQVTLHRRCSPRSIAAAPLARQLILRGRQGSSAATSVNAERGCNTPSDKPDAEEETWYFEEYGRLSTHREMLEDDVRTRSFQKAIREVCAGKIVLDVGCGTGVLSIFAAKAGAKHVVAVEASERTAMYAQETIHQNGLSDKITLISGQLESVIAKVDTVLAHACGGGDPKAEVIVSEWMGYMLVHEDMFRSVALARDRWLSSDGVLMPFRCSVWAAPFDGQDLIEELTWFWRSKPYGVDFSHLAQSALQEELRRPIIDTVEKDNVLAAPTRLWQFDCARSSAEDLRAQRFPLNFKVKYTGTFHGVAVWFACGLSPTVGLSTGPDRTATHWAQTLLFVNKENQPFIQVEPGDQIQGTLSWNVAGRGMEVNLAGAVQHIKMKDSDDRKQFNRQFDWTLKP